MMTDEQEESEFRRLFDSIPDEEFLDDPIPWYDEEVTMADLTKKKSVTVFPDHGLAYPDLYLSVYVLSQSVTEEALFAEWLTRAGCYRADTIEEADLVIFTGGSDVDPSLYKEKAHKQTNSNPKRDREEAAIYQKCVEDGVPMLGICRGAQFLHVMNGGILYQDVDNHYREHEIWDVRGMQRVLNVSSSHHQMCVDNSKGGMEVIATANVSRSREFGCGTAMKGMNPDIEAYFYRTTCCIGIQGHPEYRGYNAFSVWSLKLIEDLISSNPDLHYEGKVLRIKPSITFERDAKKLVTCDAEGCA